MRSLLRTVAEEKAMDARIDLTLKTMLALAGACSIVCAVPAFAQTGAEYPRTFPSTRIAPAPGGGGSFGASAPSGSGTTRTTEIPGEPSDDENVPPAESASPNTTSDLRSHHRAVSHRASASAADTSAIESAEGHLKLIQNSWAYERPSKTSTRIEMVHAGKFVNVIGTSRYYVQVKLKNSEIAYVPLSAVQLVTPADKLFKLTSDAAVLAAPNHSAKKLSEVHKGHDVHVVGVALNYMKIRMKNGLEGFISVSALK
jgi:hypothetical protein